MSKLIACLGYSLNQDNTVSPILEGRLRDSVKICQENPGSTLILMGGAYYKDASIRPVSQAAGMKKFLENVFPIELSQTKVLTEEDTTSTIEQLCYLREMLDSSVEFKYSDLVVVASEFFVDRVKLYINYIFNFTEIHCVGSVVPDSLREEFEKTEHKKFLEAKLWLKAYKTGDHKGVLAQQKKFQDIARSHQKENT